jgi:hypothetical protein
VTDHAGVLYLAPGVLPHLERRALSGFAALFDHEPGPFLDRNRLRDVVRIDLDAGPYFRKRQHGIKPRDRVRRWLRGGWLTSHSRDEALHLWQLDDRGFRVPDPAAVGEASGGRSLLLVAELRGVPLDRFLHAGGDPVAAGRAVARLCAKLLEERVYWPDLDARHIFLVPDREGLDPGILDVQRVAVDRPLNARRREKMRARLIRSLSGHPSRAALVETARGVFEA